MRIQDARGMTIIELLVATGLAGLTMILMASIMLETTTLSKSFEARAHDEVERLTAERQLRNAFMQAADLNYVGNTNLNSYNGSWTPNFTGVIRDFDSETYFDGTATTYTLAIFHRDARLSVTPTGPPPAGMPTAKGMTSSYRPTGVFFQTPTTKTWGVLYIDLGDKPGLLPERADLMFEGLLGVKIKNVKVFSLLGTSGAVATTGAAWPTAPVSSFEVELTFRKFINPKGMADFVFCPRTQFKSPAYPGCDDLTPSRDIHQTLRITVRNNVLTSSPAAVSGTGNIEGGATPYDRIHFFKPFTPSGML